MITIIDNPAILALYAAQKPQPAPEAEQVTAALEPQTVRAPTGNGHEAALQQKGTR